MVRKNWKRSKYNRDTYNSTISGNTIKVYKFSKGYEVAGKYPWAVYTSKNNKTAVFKTKAQSNAFAMAYMRKH